jgi:DNA-binding transcriptional MerR regulator
MSATKDIYLISDISKEFAITTRTIRFYEAEGLILPIREGQRRIYQENDRIRIKLILRGKRLGFSIKEIKEVLSLYDPKSGNKNQLTTMLLKIESRRVTLEQQREDIEQMLVELENVESGISEALHVMQKSA